MLISVSTTLLPEASMRAFAFRVSDESMTPEFKIEDVLIIEPSVAPNPGDYVLVKIADKAEAIICQYKQLSYTSKEFELITLNNNWPNIKVEEDLRIEIIGKVIQSLRKY